MTAFPSLTDRERERLSVKGVDADRSLFRLLAELNGPARAKELMTVEPEASDGCDDLTDREIEVLTLYAEGWQETAIASDLHLSRHTVYAHMKNARFKMGARTIAHAVHLAHRGGVL